MSTYVKMITTFIGSIISHITELQPILMGAALGAVFSILIVSLISSVGIATVISLSGVGSGSANLEIVSAGFLLAIYGCKVNPLGTTLAHFIGSPKIQMGNVFSKPIIFLPIILNATILGVIGVIFNIQGTPMSAGFGFCGLIGPIAAYKFMQDGISNILILTLIFFIIPVILGFISKYIFINCLKIIQPQDLLLKV